LAPGKKEKNTLCLWFIFLPTTKAHPSESPCKAQSVVTSHLPEFQDLIYNFFVPAKELHFLGRKKK